MKRGIVDLSSVIWTCLRAGKDTEFGTQYHVDGDNVTPVARTAHKPEDAAGQYVFVNSAEYGYENAVNHLTGMMDDLGLVPRNLIFVMEGKNSKADRTAIHPGYKAGRDKLPHHYEQFNLCKEELLNVFLGLGSQVCWQDGGVEADDVIGYLAQRLHGERWIVSGDKDLAQLVGGDVHHWRAGAKDRNPFGDFPHALIPHWIALVGDQSDKISGAKGFGQKSAEKMLAVFGDEGLEAMAELIRGKGLKALEDDVGELRELQRIIDDAENVYLSYELARLRIERINTLNRPLQWRAGMVKPREQCTDERLRKYAGMVRLVHASNYDEAYRFFLRHAASTPEFALDIETSTPPESDEWLAAQDKEDKVDVFGSELAGLSVTFGANCQYTFYLTHDHVEQADCKNLHVDQVRRLVELIPRERVMWVHNAQFELPVLYNTWGKEWASDAEYHGFLPNVRDTKLAAHYADENKQLGLKSLSAEKLGYQQVSYEEVTTKTILLDEWDGAGKEVARFREEVETQPEASVELSSAPPAVQADIEVDSSWLPGSQVGYEPPASPEDTETPLGPEYVKVQFKMNELSAKDVLAYGADDTICTIAHAAHFQIIMEIEGTRDVFEQVETLPAYVDAKRFVDGANFSLERMREMEEEDDRAYDQSWATLRDYLISIGYEGTVCPVYTEITPATIFEAHLHVLGEEFGNKRLRTVSKIAKAMKEQADDSSDEDKIADAYLLAAAVEADDLKSFNQLVSTRFTGEPALDPASSKQMKELLYGRLKMPVNIINDATDLEKAKQPELFDAVKRFKRRRAGDDSVRLTDTDMQLLVKKAKADETAVKFALAFDEHVFTPEAKKALASLAAMKKVKTRRSLFYNNYRGALHWKDGKVHPHVTQCGTVTRRPTASTPNIYQLPKKGEGVKFRENFVPHKKDAVVVSIDFNGQELRLAAERSQDKNLLACYVGDNLKDVHSTTAAGAMKLKWGAAAVAELFKEHGPDLPDTEDGSYELLCRLLGLPKSHPMLKIADDLRGAAKGVNFTAQFGGQAPKIAEKLIMRVEDAQLFLDARAARFPGVDIAAERAEEAARKTGHAYTMLGAIRHLGDSIRSDDRQTSSRAARQAWNMEIQGSAGEMIKLAMARMWKRGILHRYDMVFMASIYDELVFSVHRDQAVDAIREVHECMTARYASMNVPILGSISVGPDFGHQDECGNWFVQENIERAINDIFSVKEAA